MTELTEPGFTDTGLWVIMAIFGWLVPHIFIVIAEARWEIARCYNWQNKKLEHGLKAITNHSLLAISISLIIIATTAAGIALSTQGLDVRMLYILSGLSRVASAVIVFILSIRIPRWFGVYQTAGFVYEEPIGNDLRVLRFNIRWRIYRVFFQVYFVLLPFYSGSSQLAAGIPIAMISGIIGGLLVCLLVYYGRTKCKNRKRSISIGTAIILVILSAIAFAGGVWYIQVVWQKENPSKSSQSIVYASCFFAWLVAGALFHVIVWAYTRRKAKEREERRGSGLYVPERYTTNLFHPKHFVGVSAGDDHVLPPSEPMPDPLLSGGSSAAKDANDDEDDDDDEENNNNQQQDVKNNNDDREQPLRGGGGIVDKENIDTEDVEEYAKEESCSKEGKESKNNNDVTYFSLLMGKFCCCCCSRCGCAGYKMPDTDDEPPRPLFDKIIMTLKWIIWAVASCMCLYLVIINLGATYQARVTMKNLQITDTILYDHINEGPVCAFAEAGDPPYNVTTMPNATAAKEANYTVAHCGACGACSSPWSVLSIQWTTRKELASLSQNCAKLTITEGFDAAVKCHMDTIGFNYECSKCWVQDEICARDNCVFIYLQATIINNLGNFQVAPGVITSATCEEAMCEQKFVPCVGATRRRMNIISGIARPADQQCTNVDPNQWEQLFGPSNGMGPSQRRLIKFLK